jgi:glycosyltransferase involved in cell wall biosynthesis
LKLTILSVAYPLAPVGPDAVGGAEQVLTQLDCWTVQHGHRSLVIACEGSRTAGELVPIPRYEGILDQETFAWAHEDVRRAIADIVQNTDVDVLHFHGVDFHAYIGPDGPPALVTLHLPPEWYPPSVWTIARAHTHLHCVSESQAQRCPPHARLWPVIPNGIQVESFRPRWSKAGFALMLGRVCPEKGVDAAIDAASRAGVPLWIGGQVFGYGEHVRYFEEQIRPRMLRGGNRFLGPIGLARKRRLLRAARCLLIPSLAPETSSLVAMEALASGTPVIAFRSGALPDIVEDGRTGFLVEDPAGMAAAIQRADEIDPRECRRRAEERFSSRPVRTAYIAAYRRAFVEEWRELFENSPDATPFASPEWLIAWEETSGKTLEIVRARSGGRLTAVAVLDQPEFSDCRDVLAADAEAARRLWDKLPPCTLDELPADSVFVREAPDDAIVEDASWRPVVKLENLRLPAKLEKNLRLQRRKLEEAGGLFEIAGPRQTGEYLEALFCLHADRWDGAGVLQSPGIQAFHKRVAPELAQAGWLRLHGIRMKGNLEAVLYALTRNGTVYYYISGFHRAIASFGPGSLLIQAAIHHAIERGDREFDFLRGAERYKYRWGGENRINKKVQKASAQ